MKRPIFECRVKRNSTIDSGASFDGRPSFRSSQGSTVLLEKLFCQEVRILLVASTVSTDSQAAKYCSRSRRMITHVY